MRMTTGDEEAIHELDVHTPLGGSLLDVSLFLACLCGCRSWAMTLLARGANADVCAVQTEAEEGREREGGGWKDRDTQ